MLDNYLGLLANDSFLAQDFSNLSEVEKINILEYLLFSQLKNINKVKKINLIEKDKILHRVVKSFSELQKLKVALNNKQNTNTNFDEIVNILKVENENGK